LTTSSREVIVEEAAYTRRGKREKGGQPMSEEENKALVRREIEELFNHTGSLDVVEEVYAPDFIGHDPTMPEAINGIEGARQFAAGMRSAFPDLTCTIEDQIAEGDKVVSRWSASGTHHVETEEMGPATGNRMEITGISIEQISEGKVVESWDNYDAMGMMQQLGFIPSPEEAQA
jgi:steroid delta-isomerase-like uncharacterized protein